MKSPVERVACFDPECPACRLLGYTPYYEETKPGWWPQHWRWIVPQAEPDIMDAVREVARG